MAVKKSELYSILWEAANKLRGGVEPSRYKDYVLLLLFFKYVSDRYKGRRYAEFEISEGASFDDLIKAKGKTDVGERVDKIIQKFLETNNLKGALPDVSFNNPDELGKGKELVDKVSGLIAIFQNPAIDFKTNRASGDDIIGDAYEYFMMKFAQESGKSKGQFYTPSEVSRVISRLIGIGQIKSSLDKKWTLHDPAAGSGSLLIRAADEAPVDANGNSIVSIFAQEKYPDTAGLAKMNFILHGMPTADIQHDNTLAMPYYTDDFGELRKFDFIVMNPPFSDKDWSDGIKVTEDKYHRFDGYGIPPEKNGDYAWFLHVLKALDDKGKAGIILPHGVLFRGNSEESIRTKILEKRYIKGIVGLPANLFYGTGIPACIIIIDKENADKRDGIFMIDASEGYKKDGNKNRLREQDIEKIVQTFVHREEMKGYSRFVTYKEIMEENGGNLNIPRYIEKIDRSLPQNISAHLLGGIPKNDIKSINKLWDISEDLIGKIFTSRSESKDVCDLRVEPEDIENIIFEDEKVKNEINVESNIIFNSWKNSVENKLKNIEPETEPRLFIRELGLSVLGSYEEAKLLYNYDVYDFLLNYWNEKLQDDVYVIKASGYEAAREIENEYAKKKERDEQGVEIEIDDKTKLKSFDGLLLPRTIIEETYFKEELEEINKIKQEIESLDGEMNEIFEENSDEEGLLVEALNDKGDGITKTSLSKRLKELEGKKVSAEVDDLSRLLELFGTKKEDEMEKIYSSNSKLQDYDIKNKNGSFGKAKLNKALKEAIEKAEIPEIYQEEYELLLKYQALMNDKDDKNKALKEKNLELDTKVIEKYGELTIDEIKDLLFEKKWMARLHQDISYAIDQEINELSSRVFEVSKRYRHTLSEIEDKTGKTRSKVRSALERMGYKW